MSRHWRYLDPRSLRIYMLKHRVDVKVRTLVRCGRWGLCVVRLVDRGDVS